MFSPFRFDSFRPALFASLFALLALQVASQTNLSTVHHVSGYRPAHVPHREIAGDLPAEADTPSPRTAVADNSASTPWQLQATLFGAFVHDLSFATPLIGFAASEDGQVWKTADGGATWSQILNLGFPWEWYGVHAVNANDVIVSGFNDQTSQGSIRWSHDGGATWTFDIPLSATQWTSRVRFANSTQGLVLDSITGPYGHYTTDGGATAADWTQVTTQPNGAWNGPEFSLLPDLHAVAAGIQYCSSSDAGASWQCRHSVDTVFDGPVFFADNNHGWVGSGEIAPNVAGWMHHTTDGGATWSGRDLNSPWPIREILFVSNTVGWAAGGNNFTGVGGIYLSADGGQTWSLDLDSNGHEMDACDWRLVGAGYRVWCAGFGAGGSAVYTVQGASTPTFLPAAGTYLGVQTVSLSSATANATVYYTTDGSIPSTASAVYSSPIAVSSTATVEAMATAPGAAPSLVASGLFTITPAQLQFTGNSPSLTVTAGQSATAQLSIEANANVANVTFSCAGLPAGADCVFSPSPLSVTANPITVTVTFATSASAAHLHPLASSSALALVFPGLLLLPCGVFCTRRRVSLLPAGMLLALVAAVVGCGGSSGGGPQPPVQATVTVTASAPGAANATTQIPVTINPAG